MGRSHESADQLIERLGRLAEAVFQDVILSTSDAREPETIALFGGDVLSQLRDMAATEPRRPAPATAEAL